MKMDLIIGGKRTLYLLDKALLFVRGLVKLLVKQKKWKEENKSEVE